MKPVAPAWYAQFRAGTGGKRGGVKALFLTCHPYWNRAGKRRGPTNAADETGHRRQSACGLRATVNGMADPTLFPWRPVVVRGRTPSVVFRPVYEAD